MQDITPIPECPAVRREAARVEVDPGVYWDPDLSAARVEGDKVLGVACGLLKPADLADGDVYYKLVSAVFIDEVAAAGRHSVDVDVVDETGQRINGTRIWHGWPTHRLPQYDERVEATIFGGNLAHWDLYEHYDAWTVPGPYWVQVADGKSDTFWGMGLPWKRHVCYAAVYRRIIYRATPQEPETLDEALLAGAASAQVIQFNPSAALQQRIFADGFVPNSGEFDVTWHNRRYVAQRAEHLHSGEVRAYYVLDGDWGNVRYVVRDAV